MSATSGDAGDIELDLTMAIKNAVGNSPNTETASVVISSADGKIEKTVTIEGVEMTFAIPGNVFIDVDGYFLGTQESMPITALSNSTTEITISQNPSWLSLNNKTLTSDANNETSDRITYITVSNEAVTKQITVTQDKLIFAANASMDVPIKGYDSYQSLNVSTNSSRRNLLTTTNSSSWISINDINSRTPSIMVGRAELAVRSGLATVTLEAYRNAASTSKTININQQGRQGTGVAGYFLVEARVHRGFVNYIIDDIATMYITLTAGQETYNAGEFVIGGVYKKYQYNPLKSTTSIVSGVVNQNGSTYPQLRFTAYRGFSFTIAFIDEDGDEYICRVVYR